MDNLEKEIKLLTVIIPVYNEEKTITNILNQLNNVKIDHGIQLEIVIVNDCSSDNTRAVIQDFMASNNKINISYFEHEVNRGKGAGIHTGIKEAKGEYLVVQDADLEYDPNEFNDLFIPIFKDRADVVYGSRFMGNNPHRILFFWHSLGNKFLTMLSNAFTNLNLTDMETCYKMIRTSIAKELVLKENRFGFEPEVTAKLSKIPKIKIYEVGISYYGRTYDEGKKIGWKDGFRAIYCILKYNLLG